MSTPRSISTLYILFSLVSAAFGSVHFEEQFTTGWQNRWKVSPWKKDEGTAGEFKETAGKWYADQNDLGIQTTPDARFFALSSEFSSFSNEGKDLVVQFSVKHEQKLDCGGGYIKILPSSSDMSNFNGETPYSIMFGPDICGYSTKRVHVILTKNGVNHLTKKTIQCETDELSHVYTLILRPNNTYTVLIDNVEKETGSLYDHFDILLPKLIKDTEAKKPEEWDERRKIPDESDVKPEGYDDIPEKILDPDAKKPVDWDDEDDGEWAAPLIPNPEFKGPWVQKKIDNPNFSGIWEAPDIPNPDFVDDPLIYSFKDLKYVGFELWQVKSGSIFDNILITDDEKYASEFAENTTLKNKAAEKEMFDKITAEEESKQEAERKKAQEEAKLNEPDDEEDDDEYEDPAHDEL